MAKLGAARLVTEAGEGVVIANGRRRRVLLRLLEHYRVAAPARFRTTPRIVLALLCNLLPVAVAAAQP